MVVLLTFLEIQVYQIWGKWIFSLTTIALGKYGNILPNSFTASDFVR